MFRRGVPPIHRLASPSEEMENKFSNLDKEVALDFQNGSEGHEISLFFSKSVTTPFADVVFNIMHFTLTSMILEKKLSMIS